jgi:hypothetical protein
MRRITYVSSLIGPALGVLLLALVAVAPGCSGKVTQAGGLEIIISTDMTTPATFDTVYIDIEQEAADGGWRQPPLLAQYYVIPSQIRLPTTISIAAGASPYQEVLITVTGLRGGLNGQDVVQRVVQTQVPADRLAEVSVVLASVCAGKLDCPVGDSCQPLSQGTSVAGTCGGNAIDANALAAYNSADVAGAGVPSALDSGAPVTGATPDDAGDVTTAAMEPADMDADAAIVEQEGETPELTEAAVSAESGPTESGLIQPPVDSGLDGPTCTNACTLAQTQCITGAVQTCQLQASGCTQWVTTATCGVHQACMSKGGTASCTCNASVCTEAGTACQDVQTITTCAGDADGCFYVSSSSQCTMPMSCSGMSPTAACSLTCSNSCTPGQKSCSGGGLATCTLGSNGCLAYAAPIPCGPRQTCTGAAGAGMCSCNMDPTCGMTVGNLCPTTSVSVSCASDAQGCVYESASTTCVNQTCVAGTGVCTGVCAPTQKTCATDGVGLESCGTNGMWSSEVPCTYACVGNACGGVCVPGSVQCGAGNSTETCSTSGQWNTATACLVATPVCASGHCAYDLPNNGSLPNTTTQYGGYIYAVRVTPAASTRIARVGFFGAGTTGTLTFGIYNDSGGLPNTLLGSSGFLADANGQVEGTIAPAVTLTTQTAYWIVGISSMDTLINANNSSGAGYVFNSYAAYPNVPTTFPRSGSTSVGMTALNYYLVVQDQ